MPQQGSWWQWGAIVDEAKQLQAWWRENPLPSCPNDGEPLRVGPDGLMYCPYDGWTEKDRKRTD
jgi:hypothetical protein